MTRKENAKLPSPAAELTEVQYYSRQTSAKAIGKKGQKKLKESSVLVVGAGGTGCPALQYLAGAGIGKIGICDFDLVDATNLHRQPLYLVQDIGQNKAEIAANRLRSANPFIQVQAISQECNLSNVSQLLADYDVILDCTDNFTAKFCLADACRQSLKVLLQASVYGFEGQLLLWRPPTRNTASETSGDNEEYKGHEGQCFRCLWPALDSLQEGGQDCLDTCSQTGIIGAVPGLLGTMQALEAIKVLLGLPTPLSEHVLLFDLISCTTTKLKVRHNALCPFCGQSKSGGQAGRSGGSNRTDRMAATAIAAAASGARAAAGAVGAEPTEEHEFELHWSVLKTRSPRELVYVDIRSDSEREQDTITSGKLSGRKTAAWPMSDIDTDTLQLDRNLTYLFFCQKGKRSNLLVRQLRSLGHRNVFSLSQGVESLSPQSSEHAKV
jgi:adenylyltransferase/sulfurtransferase